MRPFRDVCRGIVGISLSFAVAIVLFDPLLEVPRADDSQVESEKQQAEARRERFTNWMRTFAEETKVRLDAKDGGEEQLADFVPKPVFRYSDTQQRIPDGTLWVWTHDARPVAFQKVEGNDYGQAWTICFASLSEGLLNVSWPDRNRKYASRKPGVTFSPFPRAEAPADNPRARTAQLRALKDRFAARLIVNDDGNGAEARTMPKPLFEYSDPKTKLPVGAIFGMSATGTNPDLLLLIEARDNSEGKLRWEYAYARMTANGVSLRLDDAEIWAEKGVAAAAFENWIYFFLRRDFP